MQPSHVTYLGRARKEVGISWDPGHQNRDHVSLKFRFETALPQSDA